MQNITLQELAGAIGCEVEQNSFISTICTDTRAIVPSCLFVALCGERFDGHDFVAAALEQGAVAAVVQKPIEGVSADKLLMVQNTQDSLLQMAGCYRKKQKNLRVVGVTGSAGKTTSKEFIACVSAAGFSTHKTEGNQNNEIGVPATIFAIEQQEVAVVEMGMQGLGEIHDLSAALCPDIGVITNVGVAHLLQLGSRENILRAKLEMQDGMPDGAPLLLCGDNDLLSEVEIPRLRVILYGIDNPSCAIRAGDIQESGQGTIFTILAEGGSYEAYIPCLGRHNVQNALAAFGVGRELGIPPQDCVKALEDYKPSGMRQKIVNKRGIVVVEDCYNANPDSMKAALSTLKTYPCTGRRIAVLADMLELGEISQQSHMDVGVLAARNADMLFCYGRYSGVMADAARQEGLVVVQCEGLPQLEQALAEQVKEGDVVWVKASSGMKLWTALGGLYEKFS